MGLWSKIFGGGAKATLEGANSILKSVDSLTTSAEEKKQLRATVITTMVNAQRDVIVAEAQAGGISAKWRPYTMLAFVALIICHYALFPMIAVMFPAAVPVFAAMTLPPELWTLLQVGIGGYVGGRSVEKITDKLTTAKELRKLTKLRGKINGSQGEDS
jgi:hypothetical protein